ncbi:GNAT family N-acetyltransferase [Devosia sp. 2618]|uniref:GNAT family N-acetyltransferase n=1 Tax=Devosia sp. 2618 TaxID=3156454 RepID=UPI00339A52BC
MRTNLRPIDRNDFPAIEQMFFNIFRPRRGTPDPEFIKYFERLYFSGPTGGGGGLASNDGETIGSAIAFMPLTYVVHDREVTARLACAFMSKSPQSKAAARVVLSLRARGQDLLFTDSASPVSAGHWKAGGGVVLPVHSLDFQCVFRPMSYAMWRVGVPKFFDGLWNTVDSLVSRRRARNQKIEAPADREIDLESYAALAPKMIAHFSVRPKWDRAEIEWLLTMAKDNRTLGPLRFFSVDGADGNPIGCYAYFSDARGMVRVLDMLALPGKEPAVARAMYRRLAAEGTIEARGSAHPHLLTALSPLSGMRFRHRAFTCVATRHQDILDAVARNDIYIGGLAGESWSRLMTDFY